MTLRHEDNRHEIRRKVLRGASITFHQLRTSTDCVVRNISDAGACLAIVSHHGIPDAFSLVLGSSIKHCRAAWRSGSRIGVSFSTDSPVRRALLGAEKQHDLRKLTKDRDVAMADDPQPSVNETEHDWSWARPSTFGKRTPVTLVPDAART